MDAITLALQPASASRRAAALRKPWADVPFGSAAALQASRNQLVKPAATNGLPNDVVKNVRCFDGVSSRITFRCGCTGMVNLVPVFCCLTSMETNLVLQALSYRPAEPL